jgi:hypothetical protein
MFDKWSIAKPSTEVEMMSLSQELTDAVAMCYRIQVYPHHTNMVILEDATILPFRDDEWVTISMAVTNHGDKEKLALLIPK